MPDKRSSREKTGKPRQWTRSRKERSKLLPTTFVTTGERHAGSITDEHPKTQRSQDDSKDTDDYPNLHRSRGSRKYVDHHLETQRSREKNKTLNELAEEPSSASANPSHYSQSKRDGSCRDLSPSTQWYRDRENRGSSHSRQQPMDGEAQMYVPVQEQIAAAIAGLGGLGAEKEPQDSRRPRQYSPFRDLPERDTPDADGLAPGALDGGLYREGRHVDPEEGFRGFRNQFSNDGMPNRGVNGSYPKDGRSYNVEEKYAEAQGQRYVKKDHLDPDAVSRGESGKSRTREVEYCRSRFNEEVSGQEYFGEEGSSEEYSSDEDSSKEYSSEEESEEDASIEVQFYNDGPEAPKPGKNYSGRHVGYERRPAEDGLEAGSTIGHTRVLLPPQVWASKVRQEAGAR